MMKKRFEMITKCFLSVLTCLVIISIFFALYGLFQISILDKGYATYFGYSLFEVESGSMAPTIKAKDMVIVKKTSSIKEDDIVTYELEGNYITHRVVEIKEKKVVAKGDYNNFEDKTIPRDSIIGKVVLIIPKFGIWKEIVLSPIVLIAIFFTMLLFGLGFSYEDKKLAAKKRVSYTFKDEVFEEEGSENKIFKKVKNYLNKLNIKVFKKNKNNFEISDGISSEEGKDSVDVDIEQTIDSTERKQINIKVSCKWEDDNNRDGIRPNSIIVKLMKNDEVIESKEIDSSNWECSFEGLFKYELNHEDEDNYEVKYTIDSNMVSGYKKEIMGYKIINTHNSKKINIAGEILWIDDDNKNNIRPNCVNVKLMNNGTLVASKDSKNNKYTFIDLYKYENGKEIEYTIDEDEIEGYKKSISGYDITNTYVSSDK